MAGYIIQWFVLKQSVAKIQEQTAVSKYRILKTLLTIRRQRLFDIPRPFKGTVEVDETYLGGQWKNKRKKERVQSHKRGRGTNQQPVFGILCRDGEVWAKLVDNEPSSSGWMMVESFVIPSVAETTSPPAKNRSGQLGKNNSSQLPAETISAKFSVVYFYSQINRLAWFQRSHIIGWLAG